MVHLIKLSIIYLFFFSTPNPDIHQQGAEITQIPVMLVGNKCDESAELREVTHTEGQAESATWSVSFMETSAKTNHNVTELFQVSFSFHFDFIILLAHS